MHNWLEIKNPPTAAKGGESLRTDPYLQLNGELLSVIEAHSISVHNSFTNKEFITQYGELNTKTFQVTNLNIADIYESSDNSVVSYLPSALKLCWSRQVLKQKRRCGKRTLKASVEEG